MRYIASFRFHYGRANGSELRFASINDFLSFSPDPLLPVPPCLLASYVPPPLGRGMCERVIGLRLRAGRRFACFLSCRVAHSAYARSLSSCLLLGFSSRASFFPDFRVGSRSPVSGPVRFALCFLVPCVPCFVLAFAPHPVSSVWLGRLIVSCLPVCPRLGDSVGPCHSIGAVACFSPSVSAFRLLPLRFVLWVLGSPPCPVSPCLSALRHASLPCLLRSSRPSCGSRAVLPRFAFLPALLVVGRGDD